MAQREKSQAELYLARERNPKAYWTSEAGLQRIAGWAFDGLTKLQITEQMGVEEKTLNRWAGKDMALKAALSSNADNADREVENALRKSALGYSYTETKTTVEVDEDGNKKQKIEKFERTAKPDTLAQIFYLKNRKPTVWRDNQQLDLTATVGLVQIVDDIPKSNVIEGEVVDEKRTTAGEN